jgi:hypothetical protein
MTYPKWPSEFALRRNNQRLIALRTHWADGALQACQELEDRHPGWQVWWHPKSITPGFERPAGFYASHPGHWMKKIQAYAPTAAELEPMLVEVPEHTRRCDWCRAQI